MHTLVLDGRHADDEFSSPYYEEIIVALQQRGERVVEMPLCSMDIRPCLGCFNCWVRTPGECIQVHGGQEVTQAYMQAGQVVFFTPVTFGGYSSVLKKAVDHLIPNISPFFAQVNGETHHHRRYPLYPSLLVVGVLREPDDRSAAIFKQLAERNRLNFYPPQMKCIVLVSGEPAWCLQEQLEPFFVSQEVLV